MPSVPEGLGPANQGIPAPDAPGAGSATGPFSGGTAKPSRQAAGASWREPDQRERPGRRGDLMNRLRTHVFRPSQKVRRSPRTQCQRSDASTNRTCKRRSRLRSAVLPGTQQRFRPELNSLSDLGIMMLPERCTPATARLGEPIGQRLESCSHAQTAGGFGKRAERRAALAARGDLCYRSPRRNRDRPGGVLRLFPVRADPTGEDFPCDGTSG